jgi:hypothetical protein
MGHLRVLRRIAAPGERDEERSWKWVAALLFWPFLWQFRDRWRCLRDRRKRPRLGRSCLGPGQPERRFTHPRQDPRLRLRDIAWHRHLLPSCRLRDQSGELRAGGDGGAESLVHAWVGDSATERDPERQLRKSTNSRSRSGTLRIRRVSHPSTRSASTSSRRRDSLKERATLVMSPSPSVK